MNVSVVPAVETEDPVGNTYPERFVTQDAFYVLHSRDFVPQSTPDVGSLFDDSQEQINETWARATKMSAKVSSADKNEVERLLREARKKLDEFERLRKDTSGDRQHSL